MQELKSRSSEIVLVLALILLCACIRVYYGGEQAFMIVWKGEMNFADTLVSLEDMIKMPRTELQQHHRSVFYQLEEMGYLDDSHEQLLQHVRKKNRAKKLQAEQLNRSRPHEPSKNSDSSEMPAAEDLNADSPSSKLNVPAAETR